MIEGINIVNLHHKYIGSSHTVHALRGIDIQITKGETVAIIGQNGSGKTTLVKHLNGLLKSTEGQIIINGKDIANESVDKMSKIVGFAFQNPDDQLFKSSVLEELKFGPQNIGLSDEKSQKMVEFAAEITGLKGLLEENPYDLVYSTRKLIGIASVISMDSDYIVLDEPTTGQDYDGIKKMGEMIKDLIKKKKTVITITHDMDFVAENFERTIVLCEGEKILDGPTKLVLSYTNELKRSKVKPPYLTRLGQEFKFNKPIYSVKSFKENIINLKGENL